MNRRLGGAGSRMRPAIAFAEAHGFAVAFSRCNHLVFIGFGRKVFAAGTPRSTRAALTAISKMKNVIRDQAIGAHHCATARKEENFGISHSY